MFKAASKVKVLEPTILHAVRLELEPIKPMKAMFNQSYIKSPDGTYVKKGASKICTR